MAAAAHVHAVADADDAAAADTAAVPVATTVVAVDAFVRKAAVSAEQNLKAAIGQYRTWLHVHMPLRYLRTQILQWEKPTVF